MNNNISALENQVDDVTSTIQEEDYENLSTKRAKELEEEYEEEQLPPGFYFTSDSLMYQPDVKDEDLLEPIFICSRLNITACTRDDANENHGRLLEFKDIDNHHHEWAMPMEMLAGDGTRYREELLSKGLKSLPVQKQGNF